MSNDTNECEESPGYLSDEFDPKFKYDIASQTGGENILKCYQCGTCTGVCPVFEVDERYSPQTIIKKALLGLRDDVLSSDLIWLCSTCYVCYEHCPQNVKVTDLMCAIQNIATREGYPAPALEDKIKLVKEHARTLPIDVFDNKKRSKFELPSIEEKPETIANIIENSGIENLVKESTPEPPVTTTPEPPVTSPEPPATTPEPPATTSEPPATTPEPPVTTTPEPPVTTTPEPPVTTPEPPATTSEPPATTPEPPVTTTPEPPITTPEPPVTTTPEPPVTTTPEPPVTTTPEPPATTTPEPPVTTTPEPPATTTETTEEIKKKPEDSETEGGQ